MPSGHTLILGNPVARAAAHRLIDAAPDGAVFNIREARRTSAQNDKMWAMIGDISRAKPDGRRMGPELWKAVFMQACGWECQFLEGLDGHPFPVGFHSSKLTKKQMADLITYIEVYGNEHNVIWTHPEEPSSTDI